MVALQAVMATAFASSGPFMALYLVQLGVHPMERVASWAGVINSINALVAAVAAPFWGIVADRVGRKAMVLRCSVATTLVYSLIPFCTNEWQLLGVQAFSGLFGGFTAAAMTLVGTQAPEARLGFALGWMATGQLVGGLVGPLLGGLLADRVHDYRVVFGVTALCALITSLSLSALVREGFVPARRAPGERSPSIAEQMREVASHPGLPALFFALLLAQMAVWGANPMIPLFVRSLIGDAPWLATASGAALAVAGVAGMLASPWLGRSGDRFGARRVLLLALGGAALFTIPQAVVHDFGAFTMLRFGVGLFLGGIVPQINAMIGRSFPRERRGSVYGLTSSATFIGLFSGPTLGGLVAAHFGFSAMFLTIGALLVLDLAVVGLGTRAPGAARAT